MSTEERLTRIETILQAVHNDSKDIKRWMHDQDNKINKHNIQIDRLEQSGKTSSWIAKTAIGAAIISLVTLIVKHLKGI